MSIELKLSEEVVPGPTVEPISSGGGQKSVNFGPGAEMLMNPSKQSKSNEPKSDIKLSEINDLEDIDIGDKPKQSDNISKGDFLLNAASNLSAEAPIQLNIESPPLNDLNVSKP